VEDRHGHTGDDGALDIGDCAGDICQELLSARDRGQKDEGTRKD